MSMISRLTVEIKVRLQILRCSVRNNVRLNQILFFLEGISHDEKLVSNSSSRNRTMCLHL